MPNIDDLSIGIKSNVTSATNSIDKLISRLGVLSASLGQVNTSGFQQMARGISQIEVATKNISADSANKLATLSLAIRKFGSSTANAATSNIPQLSNSIKGLANTINSIGNVNFNADGLTNFASAINKLGGVKVTTAVTNLPQLTTALQQIAVSVNQIGQIQGSVTSLTQLATALSRLGGKTVTNAITNIPQLTTALMQMMNTLSRAPQVSRNTIDLTNALANLASQGSRTGSASRSLQNSLNGYSRSAKHATKSSHSLASAIGKLYAKYWLLFRAFSKLGKGITLASDLTEVQNVVDVTFGKYKNTIEEFSKTSIQDYGMSELTAKQMAGRFQAMGTAIGFSQEKMADMSVTLTALAADMASFYNVEQKDVAESLQSVFTGTTKPLRQYSIDLTEATLNEWLMSQGIDANIKSMTQAEKVLIRYNYVLEHTKNAQGDFARTQDTWANQIRILKQQFGPLGAVIGQNFIYALKPMVQGLNVVMGKLIQFAKVVSESLGTIFGWKYEETTGGIANDLELGSDFADDLSDGLGSAANNAKKLKQQLQGFDELNVLTSNSDNAGGGAGGLGDYELPTVSGGQWVKLDEEDKFFSSELDTLYKLGEYISETLTNQLKGINWNEVYQGAKNFGSGLADFLNGLISPELFGTLGKTVAGSLNTAIYTALSFGETFDFKDLGLSIATGLNEYFAEKDFKALGKAINVWVNGLADALIVALDNVDWSKFGEALGDFFEGLDIPDLASKLLTLAGKIISSLGEALISSFETAPLETAVITLLAGLKLSGAASALGGAISSALSISEISLGKIKLYATSIIFAGSVSFAIGKKIGEEAAYGFAKLVSAFTDADIYDSIDEAKEADAKRKELESQIFANAGMDTPSDFVREFNPKKYEKLLNEAKRINLNTAFNKLGKDVAKATITLNEFGINTVKLTKITSESFKEISQTGDVFGVLSNTITEYADEIKDGVTDRFTVLKDNSSKIFGYITENLFGIKFKKGLDNLDNNTNNAVTSIGNAFNTLSNSVSNSLTRTANETSSINSRLLSSIGTTINTAINEYNRMAIGIGSSLNTLSNNTYNVMNNTKNNTIQQMSSMVGSSINESAKLVPGVSSNISSLSSVVGNGISDATYKIKNTSWYTPGINLVEGLRNGLSSKWNDTSSTGLIGKVVSLANSLTSSLKRAFGIHSPSKIWEDEIGYNLTKGLEVGVLGGEGHLNNAILGMGARLNNTMSGALTLATPKSMNTMLDFGVTSTMAHTYSADSSMSNNIAEGISRGMYAAQSEQNALLREQNELLYQLLQKEAISSDEVYNIVVNKNRDTFDRTGNNPLFA